MKDHLIKNITKEDFLKFIKPLADKSMEILDAGLRLDENILLGSFLEELIDKEVQPTELLKLLKNLTPLQSKFCESKGLTPFIENAKKYLESIKGST